MLRAQFHQNAHGMTLKFEGIGSDLCGFRRRATIALALLFARVCYARDVCERLYLALKGDAYRPDQSATEVGPS